MPVGQLPGHHVQAAHAASKQPCGQGRHPSLHVAPRQAHLAVDEAIGIGIAQLDARVEGRSVPGSARLQVPLGADRSEGGADAQGPSPPSKAGSRTPP